MEMEMSVPILIISILLFFVLFFGIGFLLNMILRMSWVMAFIYPIVFLLIVDNLEMTQYIFQPLHSLTHVGNQVLALRLADIVILSSGFIGALCSGIAIRTLRSKGYRMF